MTVRIADFEGRGALDRRGARPGRQRLAIVLLLMSLAVFFLAALVAFLVVRAKSEVWRDLDQPPPPSLLGLSTAILAALSLALQRALNAVRADRSPGQLPLVALALGVLFLASQAAAWFQLVHANMPPDAKSLYALSFYLLTALHAVHVLGGLFPLAVVTARARQGRYSSEQHDGLGLCALYWHFLGVVWLVMWGTLLLTS